MFEKTLVLPDISCRLQKRWTMLTPALVRVPLFSENTCLGYVVLYKEITREYSLQCFNPDTGDSEWQTKVPNGGYGAQAIGENVIAIPSNFSDITGIDLNSGTIKWTHKTEARVRSPIVFSDSIFTYSSGQNIYQTTEAGEIANKISLPEHFFFGLISSQKDQLFSLACFNDNAGYSKLALTAFSTDGRLCWKKKLSYGQIISSDTSGCSIFKDHIYCAAGKYIYCIKISDGSTTWEKPTSNTVGRQAPTIFKNKIYIPSVTGDIHCLNVDDGSTVWTFSGASIANTPVSILGDFACIGMDGVLYLLDAETGELFDTVPTGHSPYSALTFWRDKAYLGGGDPPYHGQLHCFDLIDRNEKPKYSCSISNVKINAEINTLDFKLNVSNAPCTIKDVALDAAGITSTTSNQAIFDFAPISRSGNCFTFSIPIRSKLTPGIHSVNFQLNLSTGKPLNQTGIVSIQPTTNKPKRHLIQKIQPRLQKTPLHSGAAVLQMIQEYYEQSITDQYKTREMVDYIKDRSTYESFNLWRISLRRVISSSASTKEDLPEYKQPSDQP